MGNFDQGMHRPREVLSNKRIVLGTEHPRLFFRGHIVRGHIVMASVSSSNATPPPALYVHSFSTLSFSLFCHLSFSFMLFFSLAYTSLLNFMIASLQRAPFPRMTTNVNALVAQNRFLLKDNWKKMFTVLPQDIPSPNSEPV
jgi:hypothetical protein